ncbi:unnamed protein product [Nyctereutes procyonoides]|uniref:(raccoon dog) hypothetical protein n=1 Tax=Nyctereutes procyonoides TaxID=34880 RepID=A0A811YG85_NYCPR|nr:unnamed protein product [Nyctereutes procyonoides]
MTGHLASDTALGGPEPCWVDLWTLLSFQAPPGRSGIGLGQVLRCGRIPFLSSEGMASCGPQVGVGLMPQGSLKTSQQRVSEGWSGEQLRGYLPPALCCPESQDIKALQKDLKQFTTLLEQKRIILVHTQADVGLTLGTLFGKPLLPNWVEEAGNSENLQEICKAETLKPVRDNLENMCLWCRKPALQPISHIAQQFRLEKDVIRISDYLQGEDFGSPFSGAPVCFPLAPGHHFTTPYSLLPDSEAFPSVSVTTLGSPVLRGRGNARERTWGLYQDFGIKFFIH